MTRRHSGVHPYRSDSVLGRQFIRSRFVRSATQRARSQHMFGSYGVSHNEGKRWNSAIYKSRRAKKL